MGNVEQFTCYRVEKERNQVRNEVEDVRSQVDHMSKLKVSGWFRHSVFRLVLLRSSRLGQKWTARKRNGAR